MMWTIIEAEVLIEIDLQNFLSLKSIPYYSRLMMKPNNPISPPASYIVYIICNNRFFIY